MLVCSLTRTGAQQAARAIELPFQQFGTVHAFAYRALGAPPIAETPEHIKEWNTLFPHFVLSSGRATPDDGFELPEDVGDADRLKLEYSRLRTMGQTPGKDDMGVRVFAQQWDDWKKQCGYLDFNDLIATAMREIDTAPGEPQVLLLDEAQDTGAAEMALLMKWAKKVEHFVVAGDFCQSLFSWRGTDSLLLQRLWEEHDPERQPLQQSYRLSRAVYREAQGWMARFQQTRRVTYLPRDAEGFVQHEPLSFSRFTSEEVSNLLDPYLSAGKSVMFLATCGYMLDTILKSLRGAGIPFANPWRPSHGGWNPLPQKRGRGYTVVDRVLAFSRPLREVWGEQARFWTAPEVKAWVGGLPISGVLKRGVKAGVKDLKDDASDAAIAAAFAGWFLPEVLPYLVPRPSLLWYLDKVQGTDRLREYVGEIIQRYGAQKLRERPRVTVGTVHSLKGSEADVVFMSPDISMQAYEQAAEKPEAAEELRRVFYTGITRARDTVVLCGAGARTHVQW